MKQHRYLNMVLATLGAMLLLIPLAVGRQDPQQEALLQKAIQIETVDGDLNAAIKLYRQIVENPGENRTVAAKALLPECLCLSLCEMAATGKDWRTLPDQAIPVCNQQPAHSFRCPALHKQMAHQMCYFVELPQHPNLNHRFCWP